MGSSLPMADQRCALDSLPVQPTDQPSYSSILYLCLFVLLLAEIEQMRRILGIAQAFEDLDRGQVPIFNEARDNLNAKIGDPAFRLSDQSVSDSLPAICWRNRDAIDPALAPIVRAKDRADYFRIELGHEIDGIALLDLFSNLLFAISPFRLKGQL